MTITCKHCGKPMLEFPEGWHSLKRDPSDLPTQEGLMILFAYHTDTDTHLHYNTIDSAKYFCNHVAHSKWHFVAWRYIEPLEA